MDLQAEMEQQLRRFEAIMSEVYMEHEKLMEKMNRDFQLEKDELEHKKKEFRLRSKKCMPNIRLTDNVLRMRNGRRSRQ